MVCWQRSGDDVLLAVRAQPGASQNRIVGVVADADGNERLKVQVTAPPEDGKANAAIIKLLATAMRVPKSACTVTVGHTSRNKTIAVSGADERAVRSILP